MTEQQPAPDCNINIIDENAELNKKIAQNK
jgi:hypothetical protein